MLSASFLFKFVFVQFYFDSIHFLFFSSLHIFPAEGSPNLSSNSQKSIPPDVEKKYGCSSPMLKTLLEPAPRSRSSDNLEKFSPLIGRRSQGDSPLTASPLARRMMSESSHEKTLYEGSAESGINENMSESLQRNTLPIVGSSMTSRPALRDSSTEETGRSLQTSASFSSSDRDTESRRALMKRADTEKTGQVSSVKLRSTAFDLKSPTNGAGSKNIYSDTSKSPVLKSFTKGNGPNSKITPPITAPKPRPWSMATDRKSGANNWDLKSWAR